MLSTRFGGNKRIIKKAVRKQLAALFSKNVGEGNYDIINGYPRMRKEQCVCAKSAPEALNGLISPVMRRYLRHKRLLTKGHPSSQKISTSNLSVQ